MTSNEFDGMVVQGAVKLMLENERKFLERGGMILAKEFEGDLWIKASHHEGKVKAAVAAEREACCKAIKEIDDYQSLAYSECIKAIQARGPK